MGNITEVKSARKEHKCSKCGKLIEVGQSYLKGVINFHPDIVRCKDCGLAYWEVTSSDYVLSVGAIAYKWTEDFEASEDGISDIKDALQDILDDCQDKLDNMPESLQDSHTGEVLQERIGNLESVIDELDSIDIDNLKSEVVEQVMMEQDDYDSNKTYDWDEEYEKGSESGLSIDLNESLSESISQSINDALSGLEV